jgi:acyl carrier protein
MSNVRDTIVPILSKYSGIPAKDMTDDIELKELFDSLAMMEIAYRIEEHFDISIDDSVLYNIKTIPDIVKEVEKIISSRNT